MEDGTGKSTPFSILCGSAAVCAHPGFQRPHPIKVPSTEVVDAEILKAETHPHCAAKLSCRQRSHTAWPGGVPVSGELGVRAKER